MDQCRVIVTGSREFDDEAALRTALDKILSRLEPDYLLVIVHGNQQNPDYCTNADRIAVRWALEVRERGLPVDLEAWPADWEGPCKNWCPPGHRQEHRGKSLCPDAGMYRTRAMCERGAELGLVAMRVHTESTTMRECARWLIRNNIPVQLIVQGDAEGLPKGLIEQTGR